MTIQSVLVLETQPGSGSGCEETRYHVAGTGKEVTAGNQVTGYGISGTGCDVAGTGYGEPDI